MSQSKQNKGMDLEQRLTQIDYIQANRFKKLTGVAREFATEGIIRHLRACARMDINPCSSAIREVIDDAQNGRRVWIDVPLEKQALAG